MESKTFKLRKIVFFNANKYSIKLWASPNETNSLMNDVTVIIESVNNNEIYYSKTKNAFFGSYQDAIEETIKEFSSHNSVLEFLKWNGNLD